VTKTFDEGIVIDDTDDQPYEESELAYVADELYFESGNAFDDVLSPLKNHNDLSRFQNNITTYVSPMTKRLHHDIEQNSPSRICHHNTESLRASRKNMMNNIDYIISIGDIEEDSQAAMLFDKMETSIEKIKLEFQQLKLSHPKTPPRKGMIEFPAFNGPKKKPESRLKGFGG